MIIRHCILFFSIWILLLSFKESWHFLQQAFKLLTDHLDSSKTSLLCYVKAEENPMDGGGWWAAVLMYSIQWKVKVLVTPSCLTLCDPVDCSPPAFSFHGILQAKIPEWVPIPFSKGSFWPRDRTWISYIAGRFFSNWLIREAVTAKARD